MSSCKTITYFVINQFCAILLLQILPGSHKCGRIEHKFVAGQTGADLDRVNMLLKKHDLTYVEMEAGTLDSLIKMCPQKRKKGLDFTMNLVAIILTVVIIP